MEDVDTTDVREGTDPMKAMEWNELGITFTWKAGEPSLSSGSVTVSYHPVTDDVTMRPRYVAGPTNDVIAINDCTTTLLFPFVTNQQGYNTGLAITNASDGKGYCTIEYSGPDAPDDMMTPSRSRVGDSGSILCQILPPNSRAISLQAVNFGMRTALPSSPEEE